jgi:pimeloyl-ACP methyl ester carboxylesterase
VCAVLAAGVATPPATAAVESPTGTNGATVPELDWAACTAATPEEAEALRGYECATADVPLSYRDPDGQSIELALARLPAADPQAKIGSLFWNPGGPGGSGRIPPVFTQRLHERFDLVGFDPRGVGESTPLRCFASNEQAFDLLGQEFPITLAQERAVIERTRQGTEVCARQGGPLLDHMSTANVARDLDLLRAAVGDERLTYIGFSYGTHLGEVYANLFPERVRALTLDAVLDPVEWTGSAPQDAQRPITARLGSEVGARQALRSFLAECAVDERCAFREEGRDLEDKADRVFARLRRQALEVVDPETGQTTRITYQLVTSVTLALLYDDALSPLLAEILQEVWTATGRRAAGATELRAPRLARLEAPAQPGLQAPAPEDEPYAGVETFAAVACVDGLNPANPYAWPRWARRADRRGGPFGSRWVYLSLPCATWPGQDPDRYAGPWDRDTAGRVLLIGNRRGDPATQYEDARRVDGILRDARLLTLDAWGHTAIGKSACVDRAVERMLIELEHPALNTVCAPDRRPFDPLVIDEEVAPGLREAPTVTQR